MYFIWAGIVFEKEISAGFGNINASSIVNPKSAGAYKAGIGVGYELNGFRLETGLAYFKTGFKYTDLDLGFEDQFDPTTGNSDFVKDIYYHFETVLIPLKAGYVFNVARIRIIPEIGAAAIRTISGNTVAVYAKTNREVTSPLSAAYNKSHMLISAGVHAEFPVSKKILVVVGPSFYRYLTRHVKGGWMQYAGLLDAGVLYSF